ncbi:MAG TPA: hypothetical protein VNR91_02540 [Sphingomonas sp.]|nr:hypothetical protein [Sphingomonas sp.]HWK35117.1 hypothetical protein [Sphingomonas sp.]
MHPASVITVNLGGGAVALRPTLACAMRLEARPGGVSGLLDELKDGSVSAVCEIVSPHHNPPHLAKQVLRAGPDRLLAPLLEYLLGCVGADALIIERAAYRLGRRTGMVFLKDAQDGFGFLAHDHGRATIRRIVGIPVSTPPSRLARR